MSALAQQAINIFNSLDEQDQLFAFDFLTRLGKKQELEQKVRNTEYLNRIQKSIDQIAEGRGIERELIEVSEDD